MGDWKDKARRELKRKWEKERKARRPFLGVLLLPPELRDKIYNYCFADVKKARFSAKGRVSVNEIPLKQVNRQLRREVLPMWHTQFLLAAPTIECRIKDFDIYHLTAAILRLTPAERKMTMSERHSRCELVVMWIMSYSRETKIFRWNTSYNYNYDRVLLWLMQLVDNIWDDYLTFKCNKW